MLITYTFVSVIFITQWMLIL